MFNLSVSVNEGYNGRRQSYSYFVTLRNSVPVLFIVGNDCVEELTTNTVPLHIRQWIFFQITRYAKNTLLRHFYMTAKTCTRERGR
jgi:hypothetical protein